MLYNIIMSDFPFDTFRGIQNGDDATLDDVNVQQITFPDGSTQTAAAGAGSVVTDLEYAGTTLTLKQSGGIDKTATINTGGLPFAFAQTDARTEYVDPYYDNTPLAGSQITELSQTITPTSSSQKVVIHLHLFGEWTTAPYQGAVLFERKIGSGTATLIQPQNAGSRMAIATGFATSGAGGESHTTPEMSNVVYVDSPNTTDTITYVPRLVCRINNSRSFYLNRSVDDTNAEYSERAFSTMTLECKNV